MGDKSTNLSVTDAQSMFADFGYTIEEELSNGAFKQVFRASRDGQHYAFKVLHHDRHEEIRQQLILRSEREVASMAHLKSPYIAKVIEYSAGGMQAGKASKPFIVEEFLSGGSLEPILKSGNYAHSQVIHWSDNILQALLTCEESGLYHRDIKPANILLRDGKIAVLTDFGLARPIDASTLTTTGISVGTPMYAPPEQLMYDKNVVDHTSDLFAFGIMLYQFLAGSPHHPYIYGNSPNSAIHQMLKADARPITDVKPSINKKLSYFVMRLIRRERAKRFASVQVAYREFQKVKASEL